MGIKFYSIILALVIITVFILQIIVPNFTEAFVLNSKAFPEIYRFLTAIFLHGSLSHLILNLFALVLFGVILEKLTGSKRFLLVFFVSGILANIIAFNFYPSSLGASGAIFGVIGALTIIKPLMTVWAFSLPMPLFVAAILWMIGDILGIFYPQGTGNIAHLSGLAVGLILGLLFRFKHARKKQQREMLSYETRFSIPEDYMRDWESRFMR